MNTLTQNQAPTFESVWALLQENALQQKENDRLFKESQIKFEKQVKENDRQMEKLRQELGGLAHSQGSFAEEYFFNSFEQDQKNFFGKKFDEIERNIKGHSKGLRDEYDIVLYNDAVVAIVEVKFKVQEKDIDKILKKAETFRVLFPVYKEFGIYLGLASLVFPSHLEQECIKKGIAIIKQIGDKVVINDERLKVY